MLLIDVDPIFLFFIGLLLVFILGTFLYVRRIIVNFRQGIDEGRR